MGPQGPSGVSPVVEAQYPLILEDGILSFDSEKVSSVLDKFKNDDIQKAINQMAQMTTPAGGGAVDVALNGKKIIRSVNTMNFIGDNVTVTRRRKNVDISISGGGGGSGVSSLIAGPGIGLSSSTGNVTVTNLLSVKATYGAIQYANSGLTDLEATNAFKLDFGSNDLYIPKGLKLNSTSTYSDSFIEFADGTTQASAPLKFTYNVNPPSGATMGDRWMDSDNGIEYVYINDGNSSQWIQPTNTSTGSSTAVSILATTGVTGATYAALASDYYIGVSYAGPVIITLPTNPETGREIVVKDESGNAGNGINRQITIVGATASQKIDNQSSAIINLDNAGLHFIYRNGWRII
jgi:hypothetical protein